MNTGLSGPVVEVTVVEEDTGMRVREFERSEDIGMVNKQSFSIKECTAKLCFTGISVTTDHEASGSVPLPVPGEIGEVFDSVVSSGCFWLSELEEVSIDSCFMDDVLEGMISGNGLFRFSPLAGFSESDVANGITLLSCFPWLFDFICSSRFRGLE